jgi:predicted O-linked N-acetylglucosamine transferase (SPINDLY family)
VLGNFVAGDARAMVEMAVGLAHDPSTPETLARLRRSLRQELAASEVCDTARLAVEMERIYETLCQ